MKIAIGCDHAGVELKEAIKRYLSETFHAEMTDVGTDGAASVDYPVYGKKVGKLVASEAVDSGIVICGTGIGISMAANKVKGVRAALCYDAYTAIMSRKHNNANVLCIPSRFVSFQLAEGMLKTFLGTAFEGGRHEKRVEKI